MAERWHWVGCGDMDWVWVSLNDYRLGPIGGNDLFTRAGTETLGRLNRVTSKFTRVEWLPAPREPDSSALTATQFVNLPGRIQWLASVDWDTWDAYELDKKSLQVTRALKIIAPSLAVTTKGSNLWLRAQSQSRDSEDFWLQILSADEKGIWLSALAQSLLAIRNDGQSSDYDLRFILVHQDAQFARQAHDGNLLRFVNNQLMQLADGKAKQLSLSGVWVEPQRRQEEKHRCR